MPVTTDPTSSRRSAPVMVTDGEQRAALAVVRSLGQAGYPVYVVSRSGRSLAGASRWAIAEGPVRSAYADPVGFLDDVTLLAERWQARVLVPITDASLQAVQESPDRLAPLLVPFPPLEVVRAISDKARVMQEGAALGLKVPRQWRIDAPGPLPTDLAFPLVCKPSRSVAGAPGARVQVKVSHARDAEELEARLAAYPLEAWPMLLQERIVGPGTGVFLLLWQGRLVAACAHRRLREKPPAGGVSTYRESVALDGELLARSRALLERAGWSGVAMVEFKVDQRTGASYLMEVNGRFWGSLQLAVDAGVDFPVLLVDLARGGQVADVTSYTVGVRSRWWWGDVDQLLLRLRRSAAALALPPGAGGRWRALLEFMARRRGDREEVWRSDDPRPFLRETLNWFRRR